MNTIGIQLDEEEARVVQAALRHYRVDTRRCDHAAKQHVAEILKKVAYQIKSLNAPRLNAYRQAADEQSREGELEVDDCAPVSYMKGNGGAYVQAWLWIADSDAGLD